MNLKNQPPILVPEQFIPAIEKYSKAKLMDIVWDLATRAAGCDEFNAPAIMDEIRDTAEIVQNYRNQDKKERGK